MGRGEGKRQDHWSFKRCKAFLSSANVWPSPPDLPPPEMRMKTCGVVSRKPREGSLQEKGKRLLAREGRVPTCLKRSNLLLYHLFSFLPFPFFSLPLPHSVNKTLLKGRRTYPDGPGQQQTDASALWVQPTICISAWNPEPHRHKHPRFLINVCH